MNEKRYYFFKMEDDWFQKKEIKKLRSIAGGDTYIIIYQKLILKSLKTGGKLYFEGIEENFVNEMALELDEKPDNVSVTLNYLLQKCLIDELSENEFQVNDIGGKIETKTSTALRVSRWREKNKRDKPLQLNNIVTQLKQSVNGESESESESESEKETKKRRVKKQEEIYYPNKQEIIDYGISIGYNLDSDKIISHYTSYENYCAGKPWRRMDGKIVKDWKRTLKNNWCNEKNKIKQDIIRPALSNKF